MLSFDDLLILLGEFGPFQRRIYFIISLVALPGALHTFSLVFLAAKTDYWCAVPELREYNCSPISPQGSYQLESQTATCDSLKKRLSIPEEFDEQTGEYVYSKCTRYNLTGYDKQSIAALLSRSAALVEDEGERKDEQGYVEVSNNGSDANYELDFENGNVSRPMIGCDAGWQFNTSQYKSTINQQYGLVCDRAGDSRYAHSAYFAGYMVGVFIIGILSDWVGRKPTFFISLLVTVAASIGQAFAPNIAVFAIVRFMVGMSKNGLYLMAFIIGTELVGPSKRAFAGQFINVYYAIGYMLLTVLAYFIRYWKTLQLVITAALVPFFFLYPFIPESPRWLNAKGRHAEMEKIICKAAKVNKVKLPDNLFEDLSRAFKDEAIQLQQQSRRPTYLDLFRTPNLRCATINVAFCWFVNNMVYYGLSISTSDLGVNHYVASFVSGAVEIPAYILAIFTMQYFGRRFSLCGYLVTSGIACVVATLFHPGVARAVVAMAGKFCVTASFGVVYTYSAELFPTPIRTMGISLCSMAARVSGILCPFVLGLSSFWYSLPFIIFGLFAISSGLLVLLLSETLGKKLPETVQEAERNHKISINCMDVCKRGARPRDLSDDVKMTDVPNEKPLAYKALPVDEPITDYVDKGVNELVQTA